MIKEAIGEYQAALSLDPNYVFAQVNLGAALDDLKDKKGARVALEKAVRMAPQSKEAWNNLGAVAAEMGDTPRALEALQKATALDVLATRSSPKAAGKITLLQLDPRTGQVVRTIRDGQLGCPCGANLFAIDGTLWERGGHDGSLIIVRNMKSGRIQRVSRAPEGSVDGAVGFGSIWLLRTLLDPKAGRPINAVQRLDELSGTSDRDDSHRRRLDRQRDDRDRQRRRLGVAK